MRKCVISSGRSLFIAKFLKNYVFCVKVIYQELLEKDSIDSIQKKAPVDGGAIGMTIRTMDIKDFEKIYDLWIHTEGIGLNSTDDSKEGIAKYLLRNPHTCFVAEDNGKIIGSIMSGHDGRRGFIYHTTVKEEYRGQGIGKKLVDFAMKALEAEGIHKAALVVFENNLSGNDFWERAGFTVRDDLVYRNKKIIKVGDF